MLEKRGLQGKVVTFVTFLLITVAFNKDWNGIQAVWWGCVTIFCLGMFYDGQQMIYLDMPYIKWNCIFIGVCACSALWASDLSRVMNVMASVVVYFVILLLLQSRVKTEDDIRHLCAIILAATLVNAVYLVFTNWDSFANLDTNELSTANRLGAEGSWNANEIGMIMAVSVIVAIDMLTRVKSITNKIWLYIAIAFLGVVALITGSRKAVIMILLGVVFYLMLNAKGKKFRSMLVITIICAATYYIIMEIDFFYAIIGWRMESFIEGNTGSGELDSSSEIREELIQAAWETFKKHPVIGVGLDCFRLTNRRSLYAHNNYLEILADLGIVGFISYYGGYFYVLKQLIKEKKQGGLRNLFLSIMGCVLVTEYACVSYSMFLFEFLIMLMFMWVKVEKTQGSAGNTNV